MPEVTSKQGPTVRHNASREAEGPVNVIQEKISEYRGSKRLSCSDIEYILREPIDYNQDGIVYLVSTGVNRGRQTYNEVYRDIRLRLRGNRKRYEFV